MRNIDGDRQWTGWLEGAPWMTNNPGLSNLLFCVRVWVRV